MLRLSWLRKPAAALVLSVAAVVVVLVVNPGGGGPTGRLVIIDDGEGQAGAKAIGTGVQSAVFGDATLCTTGAPVTLRSIEYRVQTQPDAIVTQVRVVTDEEAGRRGGAAFASMIGSLPGLLEEKGMSGTLRDLPGTEVTEKCSSDAPGYLDVLTGIKASNGGQLLGFTLRYEVGGQERSVESKWGYMVCAPTATDESWAGG